MRLWGGMQRTEWHRDYRIIAQLTKLDLGLLDDMKKNCL